MNETDLLIVEAMERFGGGFVKALAGAARKADSENLRRIREAFPDIWGKYYGCVKDGWLEK